MFIQSSILSEKPGYLAENNHRVKYFLLKFAHVFYLAMYKRVLEIFLISFRFCVKVASVVDIKLFFYGLIKNIWFLRTRFLHFY